MPQTKSLSIMKRRVYLSALFILFICLIPVVILYSQGYRMDNLFDFIKTGGIYLSADLSGVDVYINGSLEKKTSMFQKSFFIQDLRQGNYNVTLLKQGYFPWSKNFYVYGERVEEGRAFLLPLVPDITEIPKFLDVSGNPTTTPTLSKKINLGYSSVLNLFSEKLNAKKTNLAAEDFSSGLVISNKISLQKNGEAIEATWNGNLEDVPYFFCVDSSLCRKRSSVNFNSEVKSFNFFPGRDDLVIVSIDDGIYVSEIDNRPERNIQPLYKKSGADFRIGPGSNLYVKDGDKIYLVNI